MPLRGAGGRIPWLWTVSRDRWQDSRGLDMRGLSAVKSSVSLEGCDGVARVPRGRFEGYPRVGVVEKGCPYITRLSAQGRFVQQLVKQDGNDRGHFACASWEGFPLDFCAGKARKAFVGDLILVRR